VIRFVAITDRRLCKDIPGHVAKILAGVPRGSVAIQVREKDLDGGPLLALVERVIAVARPAGATVWVNDRVDVALATGADGVHLPERGLSIADARAAGATRIAVSRHDREGVLAAVGAELVQLGPIWATPDKGEPLGVGALAIERPLVAVGGIDGPDRAVQAVQAGATAVAAIRACWDADGPARVAAIVAAIHALH